MSKSRIAFFPQSAASSSQEIAEKPDAKSLEWLDLISAETKKHCEYLSSINLEDRASYFNVKAFVYQDLSGTPDISRFNHKMAIPDLVNIFNAKERNTLFGTSEQDDLHQEQEIERVLDIRLYPTLKRLIVESGVAVFLGFKPELQAYTQDKKEKLIIEIEIPSSVKFYLALDALGNIKVYMSELVSHENLMQQLVTLKLAGIDINQVSILGDTKQYKLICQRDLLAFEKQDHANLPKRNVLIVAGCSLEDTVCSSLEQILGGDINKKKFTGNIVSLTTVQSESTPGLGFIVLNLNYGEICEDQVFTLLEKFNCIGIFSGSAAGFIPSLQGSYFPDIGTRVSVNVAKNYLGEVVSLDGKDKNLHLQVPTIFVETFDWLKKAKESKATSVDVETFYILKAVKKYKQTYPHTTLHTDLGIFISDYVGEKPLRSYGEVFKQYPSALQNFVEKTLLASIMTPYQNNRTSIPEFSPEYYSMKPNKITITPGMKKEAAVDSIGKYWDKSEFSKRVHTPITIGEVKDKAAFSNTGAPRCLHLPIKMPGSDIRIPPEYQHFYDVLQQIFDFEASVNSDWDEQYAYLTIDRSFVPAANTQRVPGPHVDGIPRDRDNPGNQKIDHAYLVTDEIPTMFYTQKFNVDDYDPKIHHFFAIFRALSDEARTITVEKFKIALMDAYSVHTPTEALHDVFRTFIRLEFSTLKFDRVNNSVSPYFSSYPGYPFEYVPRPIPENLFVPASIYVEKPITNHDYSHKTLAEFGRAMLKSVFVNDPRYKNKWSDYKDLDLIAADIMKSNTQGVVICHKGVPHGFCLYQIENKTIKWNTLFTLTGGNGQELMIYEMHILKQLADRLSLQAGLTEGAIPVSIAINKNNENMLKFFLRAARLAKVEVNIDRLEQDLWLENEMPKISLH